MVTVLPISIGSQVALRQDMPSALSLETGTGEALYAGDRRKRPRFSFHLSAFLRTPIISTDWVQSKTLNVSAVGASFETNVPLPPDSTVEYVLTFPPDMTHATEPIRVRFSGQVLRVEARTGDREGYLVAVSSNTYRFLSSEAAAACCLPEGSAARTSLPPDSL
jgi:hypothetical protein